MADRPGGVVRDAYRVVERARVGGGQAVVMLDLDFDVTRRIVAIADEVAVLRAIRALRQLFHEPCPSPWARSGGLRFPSSCQASPPVLRLSRRARVSLLRCHRSVTPSG